MSWSTRKEKGSVRPSRAGDPAKENEKAISNMLAAIEAGIITPSTKTRLMELEADRADIEKGIAHELLAEPEFERDQIIYFLERFRSGDINDEAYRIMLADTF
ncbi:MAG: hypothetical protein ACLTBV_31145 [Enterocloster bolteae]